ncbi:hypothetical protein [Myxosarcina sp. GI1(2024)]
MASLIYPALFDIYLSYTSAIALGYLNHSQFSEVFLVLYFTLKLLNAIALPTPYKLFERQLRLKPRFLSK